MASSARTEKLPFSVRKPQLDFNTMDNVYYIKYNAFGSHFSSSYNFWIPEAELYFIDSINHYKDCFKDPILSQEIKIFSGQESQHRNQHKIFINHLEKLGYELRGVKTRAKWVFYKILRHIPFALRLSVTAGLEHVTAATARQTLKLDLFDKSNLAIKRLWIWHSIEELEHKHVAYNVLQIIYPHNYPLRILGYLIGITSIGLITFYGMASLFKQDFKQGRMDFGQLKKHFKLLIRDTDMKSYLIGNFIQLLIYFKPGFHPDQIRDTNLISHHLSELKQYST